MHAMVPSSSTLRVQVAAESGNILSRPSFKFIQVGGPLVIHPSLYKSVVRWRSSVRGGWYPSIKFIQVGGLSVIHPSSFKSMVKFEVAGILHSSSYESVVGILHSSSYESVVVILQVHSSRCSVGGGWYPSFKFISSWYCLVLHCTNCKLTVC